MCGKSPRCRKRPPWLVGNGSGGGGIPCVCPEALAPLPLSVGSRWPLQRVGCRTNFYRPRCRNGLPASSAALLPISFKRPLEEDTWNCTHTGGTTWVHFLHRTWTRFPMIICPSAVKISPLRGIYIAANAAYLLSRHLSSLRSLLKATATQRRSSNELLNVPAHSFGNCKLLSVVPDGFPPPQGVKIQHRTRLRPPRKSAQWCSGLILRKMNSFALSKLLKRKLIWFLVKKQKVTVVFLSFSIAWLYTRFSRKLSFKKRAPSLLRSHIYILLYYNIFIYIILYIIYHVRNSKNDPLVVDLSFSRFRDTALRRFSFDCRFESRDDFETLYFG